MTDRVVTGQESIVLHEKTNLYGITPRADNAATLHGIIYSIVARQESIIRQTVANPRGVTNMQSSDRPGKHSSSIGSLPAQ
eukprot:2231822-Amphidinium_carterae.2